jgi:1,2-diacylglycerol 3-alpha-glucosyltransferase
MSLKVAILFCNYGPYHLARIQGFFDGIRACAWQVIGIELARSEEEYPWRTNIDCLPFPIHSVIQHQTVEQTASLELCLRLRKLLHQINPDVIVIAGYARPAMLAALLWAKQHHKPAILFSETTESDFIRTTWREQIKRKVISQYQAALVGGQPQKRYLMQLGMPEKAIFCGYNIVGNEAFHPDRIQHLPSPLDRPYFLAINRFVTKKNLPVLINAYATYRQLAGDRAWDLVLCGDGELRSQLEQQIAALALHAHIHLPGFLQQEQLLPYFAHAQCFVHTSTHEQWGLVVNEAMASGLAVLVSDRCGCVEDLLLEGINGFSFDPYKPEELTRLMLRMSSSDIDRAAMGQAALQHIQQFSPSYFADGLMQAIDYAFKSQPKSQRKSVVFPL